MTKQSIAFFSTCLILVCSVTSLLAQPLLSKKELGERYNLVQSAVPFITIAPDSRAGGMGEVGAATDADVWSMHWNPAKLGFVKKDFSVGLAYTPWLKNIGVKDLFQMYMSSYVKLDKMQSVGVSIDYFNLGEIKATDEMGIEIGEIRPNEFALSAAYARLLSKTFSFSMGLKYIYSDLSNGISAAGGDKARAGQTVAADISGYFKKEVSFGALPGIFTSGFNISNIGGKISYSASSRKEFLPATLRLGLGYSVEVDKFNEIGLYFDAHKYLVPTKPYQYVDENKNTKLIGTGNLDASVTSGMFNSFSDAPGGATEELNEIMISSGAEYWYAKQFAIRAGYNHESKTKGNRKFFTCGLGLRFSALGADFAYMIPVAGNKSPLSNTWRISLTYEIAAAKKSKTDKNAVAPIN